MWEVIYLFKASKIKDRLFKVDEDISDLINKNSRENIFNNLLNVFKQYKIMDGRYYICVTKLI